MCMCEAGTEASAAVGAVGRRANQPGVARINLAVARINLECVGITTFDGLLPQKMCGMIPISFAFLLHSGINLDGARINLDGARINLDGAGVKSREITGL